MAQLIEVLGFTHMICNAFFPTPECKKCNRNYDTMNECYNKLLIGLDKEEVDLALKQRHNR